MSDNNGTINITLKMNEKGSIKVLKTIGSESEKAGKKGEHAFERMDKSAGSFNLSANKSASTMLKIGAGVAGIIAASEALSLLKAKSIEAVNAASDLQEVSSKYETVFAGQTLAVNQWAQNLIGNYAMSRREAREYLSSIQDLLVPMGMQANAASHLSNEIVKLSTDLGSFNNLPTKQVIENIQSALVGEYETMKKYGVVINATRVQQEALNMGLADTKDNLTAAHKAQAAYKLIVESSTSAIGDMQKTADGYANTTKKLDSRWEDFSATLGNKFLPIATKIKGITSDILENLTKAIEGPGIDVEIAAIRHQIALLDQEEINTGQKSNTIIKQKNDAMSRYIKMVQKNGGLQKTAIFNSRDSKGIQEGELYVANISLSQNERKKKLLEEQLDRLLEIQKVKEKEKELDQKINPPPPVIQPEIKLPKFNFDKLNLTDKEIRMQISVDDIQATEKVLADFKEMKEKQAAINSQFTQEYKRVTLSTFDFERNQLKTQYNEYDKYITDKIALNQWYELEMKRIAQEETEAAQEAAEKLKNPIQQYADSFDDMTTSIQKGIVGTFQTMEDSLVDFVMTGKLEYKSLARSIIADMTRIMIKQTIMKGASSFIGGLFSAQGNAFNSSGVMAYAHGGTFTNKIVDQPTLFAHGGGLGIMGELGRNKPEGIFPLARTSSGDLGVKAVGGSEQAINIRINVTDKTDSKTEVTAQQPRFDGEGWVIGIVLDAMQRNRGGFKNSMKGLMAT